MSAYTRNLEDSGEDIMTHRVEKIERIIRAKTLRGKELAKLPFEKKIEVLVRLQKMAQGIKGKGRKEKKIVWRIEGRKQG